LPLANVTIRASPSSLVPVDERQAGRLMSLIEKVAKVHAEVSEEELKKQQDAN